MTALAVALAVVGAAFLAAGTACQQRISQQVGDPDRAAVLLRRVLGRPRWWLGQAVIGLGFAFYATALATGPLLVVQPLLITGLVFGTVFSARLARRRLDRVLVAGCVLCVVGLTVFLLAAHPTPTALAGSGQPAITPLVLTALLGTVLAAAGLSPNPVKDLPRALILALATGLFYGLTATLIAPVMQTVAREPTAALTRWPLYSAAALTALVGWALSQRAFQLGRLLAPVNAVISMTDPAVAVALGIAALGEHLVLSVDSLAVMLAGTTSVLAGVVLLSHRGARLLADLGSAPDQQASTIPWG